MNNTDKKNEKLRPGQKIKMLSYDELCGGSDIGTEGSIEVNISELHDFPNHPFKVRDDEQMNELVKSISLRGIINALIVREDHKGGYQIISGHRRRFAANKLGMEKVPVIVVEADDDMATIMMVDSNIQRENLTPGDRARSMKEKYDRMIHKGEISDMWSNDQLGEIYGMSGRQVQRYLRLNELIPELLEEVDRKRIQLVIGVELSYLDKEVQWYVYEEHANGTALKADRVKQLRMLADVSGDITREDVEEILTAGNKIKGREITIPENRLYEYFPADYSTEQMRSVIFELLENWKKSNEELS